MLDQVVITIQIFKNFQKTTTLRKKKNDNINCEDCKISKLKKKKKKPFNKNNQQEYFIITNRAY